MKRSTPHAFEPEEIMAYLDGELEAQQASALASHLEHCSECEALATQLRQLSERLLDFQVEACPAKLDEPIVGALRSSAGSERAKLDLGTQPQGPRMRPGLVGAVASITVVLIIGAIVFEKQTFYGGRELAYLASSRGLTADERSVPSANARSGPVRAPASAGRGPKSLETLESPGSAADFDGFFRGLADHATNSFSAGGHAVAEQQHKVVSDRIEAPEVHGPMIVETASVTILSSNYDQASGAIERVTAQHGGYVEQMTANTPTGSARSVSATLRVPEEQLEGFLADLRKLGHVEEEAHTNQEITNQYVDLTARLRNARATEQRLLELLRTRTGTLSEVLQAENELARVRREIEDMDGQRAHMEHQVRYATVQVQLNEEYREQLNPPAFSTGTRVRNSLIDGFRNLASGSVLLLLFLFAYGPSILFWLALVGAPAWFIWRRYRRPKAA